MLRKKIVIIKILIILFGIIPYVSFIGPNNFFRILTFVFFGFYLSVNILAYWHINKHIWMKYILNILDGFLLFFAISSTVFLSIYAKRIEGEGAFVFIIYPILGIFFILGFVGLILTRSIRKLEDSTRNKKAAHPLLTKP